MANVTVLEVEDEEKLATDEQLEKLKTETTVVESEKAAFEIPDYRKLQVMNIKWR